MISGMVDSDKIDCREIFLLPLRVLTATISGMVDSDKIDCREIFLLIPGFELIK